MASFDIAGALAAGHSSTAILEHLAKSGLTTFDIAGARKAGYSDNDILGEIGKTRAQPAQPPTPDTSYGSAFQQGLASPVQNIGTTMRALGVSGGQTVEGWGQAMAPTNYEPSKFDVLTPSTWGDLPRSVVEQAGQLAGSLATRAAGAAAGGVVAGPVGAAAGAFAAPAVFNAAQVLGPVAMERARAHGREEPNADDLRWAAATAAASGSIDSLSLGGGKAATSLGGRIGRHMVREGAGEGTQEVIEQAGRTAYTPQGLQLDPRQALNAAVVGAATGGAVHAPVDTFHTLRTARASGDTVRQFQRETQQAMDATGNAPSFDALSPLAQNGAAELAALEMYNQRRQTEAAGMGRRNTSDPSDTFKGVMDDVERGLRQVNDLLVKNGHLEATEGKALIDAIYEAKRHNRTAGEGGEQVSYFDTNRDRVQAMQGVDQDTKNTLLAQLRVLDIASENSLKRNAKGFLERHAGFMTGVGGAAVGSLFPGVGTATGAAVGYFGKAAATAGLRGLDRVMGNQLPPLLRKEGAVREFAERHGLRPGTTAQDLMDVRDTLMASRTARDNADAELDARVAGAIPEVDQGWTLGIAKELNLRQRDVAAAVELLPSVLENFSQQTAKDLLARNTIPEDSMRRITKALRDIVDDGTLGPLGNPRPDATQSGTVPGSQQASPGTFQGPAGPQGPVDRHGNPIRNAMAYQSAIDASRDAINAIAQNHPDLHPTAVDIGNARTQSEKQAILGKVLSNLPASQRARAEAVLSPLTAFGPPSATPAPSGPAGPSTGNVGGARGMRGERGRGQDNVLGLGRDITARTRGVPVGPAALAEGRRFKTGEAMPGESRAEPVSKTAPSARPDASVKLEPQDFHEMSDPSIDAQTFHKAIARAKEANPRGAAVTLYDVNDYRDMRLFLTADMTAGFAIKDGKDIVSVFKHPDSAWKGAAEAALNRAVREGGKTLDAFDRPQGSDLGKPGLPDMYGKAGFKAVARVGFNDEKAPPDWDYATQGRPDVVFMTHDPNHGNPYQPGDGQRVTEWDHGVQHQQDALAEANRKGNGGPDLGLDEHPDAMARRAQDAAAADTQRKAAELFAKTRITKAERSVLLPDKLDRLDAGEKAAKRGRNGVTVAEQELLPAREKAGLPILQGYTPETAKKVADYLYKEALYHLSKAGSALGWYDRKLKTAMNMMSEEFPELATDPHALTAFKAILAITSNGINVISNFDTSAKIYSTIRERVLKGDYTLPEDYAFEGKTVDAQRTAFGTWNRLLNRMNPQELTTFLTTKFTVRDVERMGREITGDPNFSVTGEAKDALVYGASVLGPKIGNGFFSNLMGHYDMTTMDRWFMTTVNRLTGNMISRATMEELLPKFKRTAEAMRTMEGQEDIMRWLKLPEDVIAQAKLGSHEAIMQFAQALWTIENRQGFPRTGNGKRVNPADGKGYSARTAADPKKNTTGVKFEDMLPISPESDEIRMAAKRLVEGFEGERAVAPEGPGHRRWLRSIMDDVVGRLNSKSIPITHADLQAVIWFPEQRYWQQFLGVGAAKTDADYEDGAVVHALKNGGEARVRAVYERQGYSPQEIEGLIARRKAMIKDNKEGSDE